MTALAGITTALPEEVIRLENLREYASLSDAERQVFDNLGIRTVIDSGKSGAELAVDAANASLGANRIEPSEIDAFIAVQGRVPDMLMTSEATRIQAAVGVGGAMTMSVSDLGCVSISSALIVGRSLLESNPQWDHVLVAHGSKPVGLLRYRHPVTVNGDGGVAFVMRRNGGPEILDIALESDGEFWDLYRVEFKDRPYGDWVEECKSLRTYSFKLAIESRNHFRAMNEALLERNGFTYSDVKHYAMQNLSIGAFRFYEEAFHFEFAKACRTNLENYGHLGSMDIILNLKTGIESGEFSEGDLVLVMNNSPVAAWSSMLVRI